MIKEVSAKEETKEVGFPKFMKGNESGVIVFMFSKSDDQVGLGSEVGVGVVVRRGTIGSGIGNYSNCWNLSCFSDYNEPITLQNEV